MRGKVHSHLNCRGQKSEVTKPKSPLPASHARSYSFIVDDKDQALRSGLRRKSFTGDTSHPIAHQLSFDGKVNIPVEHVPEDEYEQECTESVRQTAQSIYPEFPESSNYAKKSNSAKDLLNKNETASKTESGKNTSVKTQKPYAIEPSSEPFEHLSEYQSRFNDFSNNINAAYDPHNYEDERLYKNDFKHEANSSGNHSNQDRVKVNQKSTKQSHEEIQAEHEKEIEEQDKYMKEKYDLHRFLIIPDGNCLYRAVAQACLLDQNQHSVLRQLAIDHMRENRGEFKDIIEGDIDVFLSAAQQDGEWAGYPEILALSRILDININITTGGTASNRKVQLMLHHFGPTEKPPEGKHPKDCTNRESIWLSWLSNGHYDTFTEKPTENQAYDEWLASKQSRIENDAAIASRIHMDDVNKVQQLQHNRYEGSKAMSRAAYSLQSSSKGNTPIDNNCDSSYFNSEQYGNAGSEVQYDYPNDTNAPPHEYPKSADQISNDPLPSNNILFSEFDEQIARSLMSEKEVKDCPNSSCISPHKHKTSLSLSQPRSNASPTHSDSLNTEFDDQIARTLQNEEMEKAARQTRNYLLDLDYA